MKTRSKRILALAVLLASVWIAGAAYAVTYTVQLSLNGAQENPSVATAATGSGSATIDTDANTFTYNVTHNVANTTAAHIHGPAQRDKNASVMVGFPSHTSPMIGQVSFSEGPQQDAITQGRSYFNIHSNAFPGGEIRGQIPAAPGAVPSSTPWGLVTLALALVGLGAVLMMRRRREAT